MRFALSAALRSRSSRHLVAAPSRLRRATALAATGAAIVTGAVVAGPDVTAAHAATGSASITVLESRAVMVASAQRGKPYRYGAAGPHAFDCSGLVQYSYRRAGLWLPRTAQQQYWATRHIRHSQLRPGDLIFFAFNGGGRRGIDHVGIYAGDHSMWVARSTGTRIGRESLWTDRFYAGRPRA